MCNCYVVLGSSNPSPEFLLFKIPLEVNTTDGFKVSIKLIVILGLPVTRIPVYLTTRYLGASRLRATPSIPFLVRVPFSPLTLNLSLKQNNLRVKFEDTYLYLGLSPCTHILSFFHD